jgi:hypothetical protein
MATSKTTAPTMGRARNLPNASHRDRAPQASPDKPETWPVIWRVTAPACSSYGADWVFLETDDEDNARKEYANLRRTGYPVRLERMQCGPLPNGAMQALAKLRASNQQNPGETAPEVMGFWTRPEARS